MELKKNEQIDDLQINDLKIIQNKDGFCFGIDAVLLSNFARIKKGQTAVDLGTGTGIIPILMAGKSNAKKVIGIEIQEEVASMAKRSVILNNMEDKVEILNQDLVNIDKVLGVHKYDVVTSNPPYMHKNGLINENDKKAISRHEIKCNLEDVMKSASRLLKYNGKFFMINRVIRLADIIILGRKYNLEPKRIRFVHPKKDKAPNLLLIQFTKDAKPELKMEDPLYVYNEDNTYTQQINKIYSSEKIGVI
ncbi:MAG: tRNA1(Val) (adenine(37)-N6)-methyltransferase [Peptostreptococcaceae bacterium]|jgi:tRNA1Val (adenine37-N6)-methyltransferase|nr:tRNA1(Val) (adenine(37)-N6)-methyltransferase [Peptostreptococcaceae bacterium]